MTVIDMHNHYIAPEVIDYLAREGRDYATRIVERDARKYFLIQEQALRPIDGPISDARARIADMEREGITHQAISCVPFLMYPDVAPDLGLAIARVNNEAMVAMGKGDPAHFVPLASVPMQDPEGAARELEYVAKQGLRGVEIPPKVLERQLDDAEFEVFWEAAESLEMAVFIHPFEAAPSGALARYFLGNLVGESLRYGIGRGAVDLRRCARTPSEASNRSIPRGRCACVAGGATRYGISTSAGMPEGNPAAAVNLCFAIPFRHHNA